MEIDQRTKNKPTHLQLLVEVMRRAWPEPLNDDQLVDALDLDHPGWTKAKDRKGKVGIIHRVTSLALLDYAEPPFEKVDRLGGKARWRLTGAWRQGTP